MTTSKYVKWRKKLKYQISLIFHTKDYSMSNLEQSKVQGNIKSQIQHTSDPGLFSSSLVVMVQPLLWAWKGVRCKKPLDNYIIDNGLYRDHLSCSGSLQQTAMIAIWYFQTRQIWTIEQHFHIRQTGLTNGPSTYPWWHFRSELNNTSSCWTVPR